jgi:predicted Ser/Thr protein kinase
MIQKIGKYDILERVGRGGMGTVFKARDPVLDRLVALKIISHEIDVTDELRARFFREAQACARLNHPNIVTVYEMGEEGGRLYIAMEFLEGEELRRVIAQRRPLPLEEKLAIMMQVCDGLHYAHQKGVVHRDIKPGNIIVLGNGLTKILDFGIAHMASTEGALTRTGLIMGTLRYISPEQARGRADHRSDIFSAGAVFYEFLGHRPAFAGDDPIQILEQLRSEHPVPLPSIDPTIPVALGAIIERAMHKDPAQRFTDLGEMHGQLEEVQHQLAEEAQRGRERIKVKVDELLQLHAQLAEQADLKPEDMTPRLGTRPPLAAVAHAEQDVSARLAQAQELLQRIHGFAPAVARGLHCMQSGRLEEAVASLSAVVAQVPEHVRAVAALHAARTRLAEQDRDQLVRRQLADARASLEGGALHTCLEVLEEIRDSAVAIGLADEVDRLRGAAQAAIAEQDRRQEELHRRRRLAETARTSMTGARTRAAGLDAARRAATPWTAAETRAAAGATALAGEDYPAAQAAFEQAEALFLEAERLAHEAAHQHEVLRQRELAEAGRLRMTEARADAVDAHAPERAMAKWAAGEARNAEATDVLDRADYVGALALLDMASEAYVAARAEAMARAPLAGEATLSIPGDETVVETPMPPPRDLEPAPTEAADPPLETEKPPVENSTVVVPSPLPRSSPVSRKTRRLPAFAVAAAVAGTLVLGGAVAKVYWGGSVTAPAPPAPPPDLAARDLAEGLRKQVAAAREEATKSNADRLAASTFTKATEKAREGEVAFDAGQFSGAQAALGEALRNYNEATSQARETFAREGQQEASRRLQAQTDEARQIAQSAEAEQLTESLWTQAGKAEKEAARALQEGNHQKAQALFRAAVSAYREAATQAGAETARKRDAETARKRDADERTAAESARGLDAAERARGEAARARAAAERAGAVRLAPPSMAQAQRKEKEAAAAFARRDYAAAAQTFLAARSDYESAMESARHEQAREAGRAETERARRGSSTARAQAAGGDAPTLARELFKEAEQREKRAAEFETREDFSAAKQAYTEASSLYADAGARARGLRPIKAEADQAREFMDGAKQRARRESRDFEAAAAAERRATAMYDQLAFAEAGAGFKAAADLYAKAAAPPPRPPAPTVPSSGSVTISANHPGAEVWVGDLKVETRTQGTRIPQLAPGKYPVRARLDGYAEWTGSVEVFPGRNADLLIVLEPAKIPEASKPPSPRSPRRAPPPTF